jgi:phosphatidylglycerophosphate synthase
MLCGISLAERLLRMLERAGVEEAVLLADDPDLFLALRAPSRARPRLKVTVRAVPGAPFRIEDVAAAAPAAGLFLLANAASVFDSRLIGALAARASAAVLVDSAPPADRHPIVRGAPALAQGRYCGMALIDGGWCARKGGDIVSALAGGLDRGELAPLDVDGLAPYWPSLRRALRPIWFPAPAAADVARAERMLIDATQKGAQDIPALLHAPIEKWLVSHLCRRAITPNQITVAVNILAWSAAALFATGHLWWGTALALAVGILDGVDGKQARLKVETTPIGRLEHLFDSLFEYGWWLALGYHFQAAGLIPAGLRLALLLIAADILDMAAAGWVLWRKGRTMDGWSRGDRMFRLVAGRRNIYVFMLAAGLLLGAPAQAFLWIVGWAVATATIRLARASWIMSGAALAPRLRRQSA